MRAILSSIGLILGLTGVVIGAVFIFSHNPDLSPSLAYLIFLGSLGLLIYSIWSLYDWNKQEQDTVKKMILSDSSQLVAYWEYNTMHWQNFMKLELQKGRKAAYFVVWSMSFVLLLIAVFMIYVADDIELNVLPYVSLGILGVTSLGHYLMVLHQNRKQRIFLNSKKPEVHLSFYGILINRQWLIPFHYSHTTLVKVEKVTINQATCLRFTVEQNSGEGNATHKYNIPVPREETERLALVLEIFQESISRK